MLLHVVCVWTLVVKLKRILEFNETLFLKSYISYREEKKLKTIATFFLGGLLILFISLRLCDGDMESASLPAHNLSI